MITLSPDDPPDDPPDDLAATAPPAGTPARGAPPSDAARVLPEVSWDDTDEGWGERPARSDDDRILDEVPPHHVG